MTDPQHHSLFGPALRGIFAALGSDAIQKVLGLLATLIVLAALKPYDYGLWQLVLSVLTAFDVLLFSSVANMLIADVSREIGANEHGRTGTILSRAVPLFIALGALGAVLMLIAAPFISEISRIDLTVPTRIIALALIAEGLSQGYQLILQGTLSLAHAQALKVLKRVGYVIGVVALVFFLHLGIVGIALAYTFSIFIPLILYAPMVFARYRALTVKRHEDISPFLEAVWDRGRWSVASDIISAASGSLLPWIIGYYLSVSEIAYISLATMVLAQIANIAPISFILRSVLPRTLGVEGRTRAWLARSMKYSVWSQLVGGLAAMAGIFFLVPIFYPAYIAVVPLVAALLVTLPVRAIGVVASEWFFAARRQRSLFLVSNVPKMLLIVLLPGFLWGLGIFGYILHYILSTDVLAFLRLRLISREEGGAISLREILVADREDWTIFSRILDVVSKIRYTRS